MVNYPDLGNLSAASGIGGFLAYPSTVFAFFWALILMGIFVSISLSLYFREKSLKGKGNLLSSMAVVSLGVILSSLLLSLLNAISFELFLQVLVFCIIVIVIWVFSSNK